MHRCQISYIFRIFHNESSFLRPIDKIRFTKQLEQDKKGSNLHSQAGNVKIKIIVETFNIENFSQVSKDRDRVFPTIFFKHAAFSESAIRRRSSFQATYFPVETWRGNKNARIEGYVCVCVWVCSRSDGEWFEGTESQTDGVGKRSSQKSIAPFLELLVRAFPDYETPGSHVIDVKRKKIGHLVSIRYFFWIMATIFGITRWHPRTTQGCQHSKYI